MFKIIKTLLLSTIFLVSLLLCACSGNTPPTSFNLQQFHGKWVFINYWASWCESCKLEIPELNAFSKKHANNVTFFGVNYDGLQGDQLNKAIAQVHIHFTVLKTDPAPSLKLGQIDVVPMTFVFNPNGKLVDTLLGPQSQISLEKIIK